MNWLLENAALLGLIISSARTAQVPPALVLAIIEVESAGDPCAAQINATYPYTMMQAKRPAMCSVDVERMFQKTAWGLMQVMGATARELGFEGWLSELVFPETNVRLGVEFLARKMSQHSEKHGIEGVIAAYNGGAPRKGSDGKFVNQWYVNKVMEAMARYEAIVKDAEAKESETEKPKRPRKKDDPALETAEAHKDE